MEIREVVNKGLENAIAEKLITDRLEAKAIVQALSGDKKKLLLDNKDILPLAFVVSQTDISDNITEKIYAEDPSIKVHIKKADGIKCSRCWNYLETVGKDKEHPTLCSRCASIIK